MTTQISLVGLESLLRKLDSLKQDEVIEKSLNQAALRLTGWIKKNRLTGPRPTYLGVRSNRLRSSITAGKTRKVGNEFINTVGTNVEYASVHEFGSPARNIRARPFLKPALESRTNQLEIMKILTNNLDRALNG